MQCPTARDCLSRKIDDELSELEIAELDAHLAYCESCTREYRLLSLPHRIAQEIPPFAPSPFFYQKLKRRVESESRGIASWQVFVSLARQMIPALAGITLALLTVYLYLQMSSAKIDIYQDYERMFVSQEQSDRIPFIAQGDITDEIVLRAIAEQ